jgi:hypothetical protein
MAESNTQELTSLYQQISLGEMISKLEAGGIVWEQTGPASFRAAVTQGGVSWVMYLTQFRAKVVLDFKRNGAFYYSVSSDDEASVYDLYISAMGDPAYEKDKILLADIQTGVRGIEKFTYDEVMTGGAAGYGIAEQGILFGFVPSGGAQLAGVADSGVFTTFDVLAAGGLLDGGSTNVYRDVAQSGAAADGAADTTSASGFVPSGGASCDGTVMPSGSQTADTSGGAAGDGAATVTGSLPLFVAEGGASCDGAADVSLDRGFVATGGAGCDGVAVISGSVPPFVATGGVFGDGAAIDQYFGEIVVTPLCTRDTNGPVTAIDTPYFTPDVGDFLMVWISYRSLVGSMVVTYNSVPMYHNGTATGTDMFLAFYTLPMNASALGNVTISAPDMGGYVEGPAILVTKAAGLQFREVVTTNSANGFDETALFGSIPETTLRYLVVAGATWDGNGPSDGGTWGGGLSQGNFVTGYTGLSYPVSDGYVVVEELAGDVVPSNYLGGLSYNYVGLSAGIR